MKKTILSLMMLSFFFVAFAQKSELNSAKQNYALYTVSFQTKAPTKKQLETLELAKANTDKAITHDKTKDDAELWAYRAAIYSSIAVTDTVNKSNSEAAFKTAQEAIIKAKALDSKNENEKMIESSETNLSIMMQNDGIKAFGSKDYKKAYESFKYIADLMPKDTTFNMYTAIAANNAAMYNEAITYYGKAIDANPTNAALYHELATIYLSSKKDTANALKTIEQGRLKQPEFMVLIFDELNIYLARGEAAKQINKIENAISKDSQNKTLYFVLGIAQSANNQNEKAIEAYKKAIELDPNYGDAIYNLAVLYINKGNDYITAANKLPNNKSSDAKYNELKKKFELELSNSLPLLEKARELSPKEPQVLNTLKEVYVKLNKLDKAAEIKKVLEEI